MSKYTTELRYIIENEKLFPPSESDLSLKCVLEKYPLYIENYVDVTSGQTINRREELNEKIINHYYFREIGFETVPRFLFKLQAKLNEIMKLYNQKYKSVDFEFNPLWNVDMSETYTHTIEGNGTSNTTNNTDNTGTNTTVANVDTTNTAENLNVESDTPPNAVTEVDIKANTYASKTNFTKDNNTSGTDTTNTLTLDTNLHSTGEIISTDTRTEEYTRREFGSSKGYTFAQNIDQWRNIMINVDMEIVEELNSLFMNVW